MLALHHYPGNASMIPHILLHELKLPFELKLVNRTQGAHKSPAYLKLNPNGLIPVLEDGPLVLYETAAICLHLADRHPNGKLLPPLGTAERAEAYKWLMFLTNSLQADFWQYFRPEFYVPEEQFAAYKATMAEHVVRHLTVLNDRLASARFLAGDNLSVADFYLFMLGRWTRRTAQPARDFPHLGRFMKEMAERASVQKVRTVERLDDPFY